MASVTFFVRFVAILLLVVSIVCYDWVAWVGHGKHKIENGNLVKLFGNTKMAEKPEDLALYKMMPGSCDDVEMGNDGNITIWYSKNSNTAKEGCTIDFATTDGSQMEKYDFPMYFGIQHNKELTDCLVDSREDDSAMSYNLLAFSFSLKNGEFDRVTGGYAERHKNFCSDVSDCYGTRGKCLDVADYSVGWVRDGDNVSTIILPIGHNQHWICNTAKSHNKLEIDAIYLLDKKMDFIACGNSTRTYSCFKRENVRIPKRWRITDPDHKHGYYNYFFSFHILPTTSMQASMQNIWLNCKENSDKENCKENAAFQKCDKMFVKFPLFAYKMLVPDNTVKQPTTEETTTMATCPPVVTCPDAGNCPPVAECPPCVTGCPNVVSNIIQPQNSTEKVEIKPQNGSNLPGVPPTTKPSTNDCYNEGTKKDPKKTLQITLVIVGSIILLLMFTALLICLFVSKSK
uniref:Uncharacterized protein n=1 Tax=Meloidogyne incognita TaxID=6306 RepID=A0A914MAP7_MELIC